jgi:hypothetical protein
MVLYRATRDKRFLEPIPRALRYLRTCLRDDGRLARFYELKTNKPLYFNKRYELTYDDREMPDHYGFIWESELDEISRAYQELTGASKRTLFDDDDFAAARADAEQAINQQHSSGAWLTSGFVRNLEGRKVTPEIGVVSSAVFIKNVRTLTAYLSLVAHPVDR